MKTTREKSPHAQVAALCKKYVKSLGLDVTAKSTSYSMGDSVKVSVINATLTQRKQIEKELSQYQYGSFDGMTDMYEYTNRRRDIPQTKFLFVNFDYSPEWEQAAYEWILANFATEEDRATLPKDYAPIKSRGAFTIRGDWHTYTIHRAMSGALGITRRHGEDETFFDSEFFAKLVKEETPAPAPIVEPIAGEIGIVEIFHTKLKQAIHIVTFPRVSREQYEALLASAKALGGWYSRAWNNSPAGFAFKAPDTAHHFANNYKF